MITRDLIKNKINEIPEQYLEVLDCIIQALQVLPADIAPIQLSSEQAWAAFVNDHYGLFREEPLERGELCEITPSRKFQTCGKVAIITTRL